MKEEINGQIFIDMPPVDESINEQDETVFNASESFPMEVVNDKKEMAREIYSRRIAKWRDIATAPQVRNKCVKMCRTDFPPIKFCCGWKVQTKWLDKHATLVVTTSKPQDVEKMIQDCMKETAIITAIAAIVSGGSAAVASGETAFKACLTRKLAEELLSVKIKVTSKWSKWS